MQQLCDNNKTTFTCDECKKVLPVSERAYAWEEIEDDICLGCLEKYPNKTGYCSPYCRASGRCDDSC